MQNKELITLVQLPIIKQALEEISQNIDFEIKKAKELIPSDEEKTKTHLKKVRSNLKKDFEWIEGQRKAVKTEIMKPYLEFEEIYKEKIADKYKEADSYFKEKIDALEAEAKAEKEAGIKDYFEDLITAKDIKGIEYRDLNIKVNLSCSQKSYYKLVEEKISQIESDFKAINALNLDENEKLDILVEYKKSLDLGEAMLKLEDRKKDIEKLTGKEMPKEALEAPEDDEVYTVYFKVISTKAKLKKLKQFLGENEMKYENN